MRKSHPEGQTTKFIHVTPPPFTVTPAKAGVSVRNGPELHACEIPAFAGMTLKTKAARISPEPGGRGSPTTS